MNLTQTAELLLDALAERWPVFLEGPPGSAKSSLIRTAAETYRELAGFKRCEFTPDPMEDTYGMVDCRLALYDSVDLRGIPGAHPTEAGLCAWRVPSFLPRRGAGVLILDEITQAVMSVQSAALQLVHSSDRRLGDYIVPDAWAIVAAGNRTKDGTGSQRMSTALSSRFVTRISVTPTIEETTAYWVRAEFDARVIGFNRWKEGLALYTEETAGLEAFPCLRTWESVSKMLKRGRDDFESLAGAIGKPTAGDFQAYLRVYSTLPDPRKILADPEAAEVPKAKDVLYALCGSLTEVLRKDPAQYAKAFVYYMLRLPLDFGLLLCRDGWSVAAQDVGSILQRDKRCQPWFVKHGDVIRQTITATR